MMLFIVFYCLPSELIAFGGVDEFGSCGGMEWCTVPAFSYSSHLHWTTLPGGLGLPCGLSAPATLIIGTKLFVISGRMNEKWNTHCWSLDLSPLSSLSSSSSSPSLQWVRCPDIPTPRSSAVCCALNSNSLIVVAGGRDSEQAFDTVEAFSPSANCWCTLPSMKRALCFASCGVVRGGQSMIVCGGSLADYSDVTTACERFDADRRVWVSLAHMKQARVDAGAVSLPDGSVMVMGGATGFEPSGAKRLTSVEIYQPSTNSWKEGISMPKPRSQFATAVCGGSVYVVGGWGGRPRADCWRFDIVSCSWSILPSSADLRSARVYLRCCICLENCEVGHFQL